MWLRRVDMTYQTPVIEFYRSGEPYGAFSNFASYPVALDGETWPTSEHYFQAQKFPDAGYRAAIRAARSPKIAARLGRSREHPIRADWEAVKEDVTRRVLLAKFTQHPDLRDLLLSTGDALIVEHTDRDRYWGDGGDGAGQNRLGMLLMEVREMLRAETHREETNPS
jgi:hypothetical protein